MAAVSSSLDLDERSTRYSAFKKVTSFITQAELSAIQAERELQEWRKSSHSLPPPPRH